MLLKTQELAGGRPSQTSFFDVCNRQRSGKLCQTFELAVRDPWAWGWCFLKNAGNGDNGTGDRKHSAAVGRNQNGTLCALRGSQTLTQRPRSVSVGSAPRISAKTPHPLIPFPSSLSPGEREEGEGSQGEG
jgi:hypothetical protein